jgi:hypothetical protein
MAWTLFLHPLASVCWTVPCAFFPLGGAGWQPQLGLFFNTMPSHPGTRGLWPPSPSAGRTQLILRLLLLPDGWTPLIPCTLPPSSYQSRGIPPQPLCHSAAPSQTTLPSYFQFPQSLAPLLSATFTLTRASASTKTPLPPTSSVPAARSPPSRARISTRCFGCTTSAPAMSPLLTIFPGTSFLWGIMSWWTQLTSVMLPQTNCRSRTHLQPPSTCKAPRPRWVTTAHVLTPPYHLSIRTLTASTPLQTLPLLPRQQSCLPLLSPWGVAVLAASVLSHLSNSDTLVIWGKPSLPVTGGSSTRSSKLSLASSDSASRCFTPPYRLNSVDFAKHVFLAKKRST